MTNQILVAERTQPVEGMEGVVFRDARYGPVEVVQVVNEELAPRRWKVSLWVKPASPERVAFLEGCEVSLGYVLEAFAPREAMPAAVA